MLKNNNARIQNHLKVFLSSPFQDLINEREVVYNALLQNDFIPKGMELFTASTNSTWEYIKKEIEDSDTFVMIIGKRYGSYYKYKISYTESELRYALSIHKQIFCFILDDKVSVPMEKTDLDEIKSAKLQKFKDFLRKKFNPSLWTNSDNLALKVITSLNKYIREKDEISIEFNNYINQPVQYSWENRLNNSYPDIRPLEQKITEFYTLIQSRSAMEIMFKMDELIRLQE